MFIELMNKINKYFNEPLNEPLRKSREMVRVKTETQMMKEEGDFESLRKRSSVKNDRGSVKLAPRYYPNEENFLAHGHSHIGHGPVWDTRTVNFPAHTVRKSKPKKRK